jgi:alkylation response protein AidB-like acyl-CoA dehydrogenase
VNTFLSLAHKAAQDEYVKFVAEHFASAAHEYDQGKKSCKDALAALAQNGYLGINIPTSYGGRGGDLLDLTLFAEILSGHVAGLGLALAGHYSVVELLLHSGSEQQKSRYLPLLAKGEMIGAQAFSEVEAGSDYKAIKSVAKASGDGFTLSGDKAWVINGELAQLFAVLAKEDDKLALFLVDGSKAESTFKISAAKSSMGMRAALFNDITFADHKISADNKLGSASGDAAQKALLNALDVSKTVVSGVALGLADRSLEVSAERARTHEQFGQPISKYQGIQWKLADLSMDRHAAQLLTYRAAWSQTGEPEKFHQYCAMAKMYAAKVARFHSGEAVQIFGVMGASLEEDVERLYRDAKMTEIFEGTSEIQKVIIKEELGV